MANHSFFDFCTCPEWLECGGLNRDDPELNWFFRAHDLDDSGCGTTCVARALLYAFMDLNRSGWEEHMEMLAQSWQTLRQHRFAVTGINAYTPELEDEGIPGRISIASAFSQLQTDPAFTLDLVEAFSDYAGHLRRLDQILRPVSRALLPELEAAAAHAKPLYDAWSHFFHVGSPSRNLSSFHNVNLVVRTRVGSRYLYRTDQDVLQRSLAQGSSYLLTDPVE